MRTTCTFWGLDRKNQFVSPGFPSPVKSRVSPPSVQSPVFLLAPSWVVGKPRARLSLVCIYQKHVRILSEWGLFLSAVPSCVLQVLTPEQQRAFCRIGALIRGFLTRRLLKTEKVKHLCHTIMVSSLCHYSCWYCQIRIHQTCVKVCIPVRVSRIRRSSSDPSRPKLRTERPAQHKTTACRSASEPRWGPQLQGAQLCLSATFYTLCCLAPQLRAALYDIYDIFFVMPLGDRLTLLQQDRELRAERKLREMVSDSVLRGQPGFTLCPWISS